MKTLKAILPIMVIGITLFAMPQVLIGEEYILQQDETLYSVAMRYKVDINELLTLNKIENPKRVRPGQVIMIPGDPSANQEKPVLSAQEYQTYQVKSGDTYYSIARRNDISVPELLAYNNRAEGVLLRAGESLKIPVDSPDAAVDKTNPPEVNPPEEKTASPEYQLVSPPRFPIAGYLVENDDSMGGVVIKASRPGDVISLTPGVVVWVGPFKGYGKVILVEDPQGRIHIYGGMDQFQRFNGDALKSGDVLGSLREDTLFRYAMFSGQEPLAVSLSRFSRDSNN